MRQTTDLGPLHCGKTHRKKKKNGLMKLETKTHRSLNPLTHREHEEGKPASFSIHVLSFVCKRAGPTDKSEFFFFLAQNVLPLLPHPKSFILPTTTKGQEGGGDSAASLHRPLAFAFQTVSFIPSRF
mmetsp:Transcript_20823/g.41534  ORF Transcript_20823/g.41534 Transcript_20823/m.41534 type:complete len:127 (-) Transcript_20823:2315-2695(-)